MARFPLWTAATLFAFPSYHSRSIIMGAGVFFLWSCVSLCLCSSFPFYRSGPWKRSLWVMVIQAKLLSIFEVCIWQSNKSQLNSIPIFPIFSRRSPSPMLTLMRWGSRSSCSRRWRFGRDVELHSGLEQMHFKGTSATSKWIGEWLMGQN